MKNIRIRLLWHPQAQFAGYLLAQHDRLGEARGIAVECVPLDFGTGPIEALLAGDVAMAVASPAHMLESGHADELVMLLAIQQASALVYPARISAGIHGVADLAGKRIGVWPGREDLELRWFLHRSGIEAGRYQCIAMNDTVAGLLDGTVDCAQMTVYHEIHHLEEEAGSLADFSIFRASEADASLLKDGLIARRDWVEAHPAETQAVIDTVLEGWTLAFTDPDAAVSLCARLRPDMAPAEHRRQLGDIRALAMTGATLREGLGFPDPLHMRRALQAMADVEHPYEKDTTSLVDGRFWTGAPAALRSSSW
ncbi:ABC transporter substrate-binding protein [Labrys monachus]|uniref:Thiamine pyrimidine synthase n=1 Tax=Labrys monachus TaxID=217067 RepID=A0ABU0FIC3_9HYPH|nr:ABC transporter substrate-binding protein [Labrys monachus]MDQ0394360.1 NitT/TauT family transport system substrate-binding protein [Labrys monachus]